MNIDTEKGRFEGILKLSVHNIDHLEFLIQRIKKINGVVSVTRGEK